MKTSHVDILSEPNTKLERNREKQAVANKSYVFEEKFKFLGKDKTYFVITHGCQANSLDSENMIGMLKSSSFTEASSVETANFVIINSCSVRQTAENKVFGELGRLKKIKETKKDMIICLAGCMSQLENNIILIDKTYSYVDIVLGTNNLDQLLSLYHKVTNTHKRVISVLSKPDYTLSNLPRISLYNHKAFVNIMYGCDEFCTYCIVPLTRGPERSRDKDDIIKEIKELIDHGCIEVTLLGQNVNSYGLDLNNNYLFSDLLTDISNLPIKRIRFLTSYPRDLTDKDIQLFKDRENIMPHIHLPVQSGSNKILNKMNRHYTKEEYLAKIHLIRKTLPSISITTDIIVGFPMETEANFQETLDFYQECQFSGGYNFIFSARSGTPAQKFTEQIPIDVKKERHKRLSEISDSLSLAYNQTFIGKIVEVLVDEPSTKAKDNKYSGYTKEFRLVNFTAKPEDIGKLKNVKITDVKTWFLNGEIVE